MKRLIALAITTMALFTAIAQPNPKQTGLQTITTNKIHSQLEFLASDWMQGRETGEPGVDMAADYIRSMFLYAGIDPVGRGVPGFSGDEGYFQPFYLLRQAKPSVCTMTLHAEDGSTEFSESTDFRVLYAGKNNLNIASEVVFAGYGLKSELLGYNDYHKLEVKGKVVVVLDGYPGIKGEESHKQKLFVNEYDKFSSSNLASKKRDLAEELGARAIIVVNTDPQGVVNDPVNIWRYNYGKRYEGNEPPERGKRMWLPGTEEEGIVICVVTRQAGNQLLGGNGFIADYEQAATSDKPLKNSALKNARLTLSVRTESEVIQARNVLAMIKGTDTTKTVVVGAHYDHVGMRGELIFNGADDNASGTAAVLTLANAFKTAGVTPKYNLVFACWSGEEKGLLGSEYFVKSLGKNDSVIYYLNFDMIGRDDERDTVKNTATFTYSAIYPEVEDMISKGIEEYNLNLVLTYRPRMNPRGGSDFQPFAQKGIRIGYFMAGWHDAYHQPWDEFRAINIPKATEITKAAYLNIWSIAYGD
jgi:hypothetical protein